MVLSGKIDIHFSCRRVSWKWIYDWNCFCSLGFLVDWWNLFNDRVPDDCFRWFNIFCILVSHLAVNNHQSSTGFKINYPPIIRGLGFGVWGLGFGVWGL